MPNSLGAAIGTGITSMIGSGLKAGKAGFANNKVGVFSVGKGLSTIKNETAQGRSLGAATLKGGANMLLYSQVPQVMAASRIASMVGTTTAAAVQFRSRRHQEITMDSRHDVVGGYFQDTEQAQTMRQAAVQQIQANKMNARSALGGEARLIGMKKYNQYTRPYV